LSKPAARTIATPGAVLKARPDADTTLNLILSRLEDMKGKDVTIDLRGKSSITDYMVVTSGRVNRHVGAIAENVAKGLKEAGIAPLTSEGLPIAIGADRAATCGTRVRQKCRVLQSRDDVVLDKPAGQRSAEAVLTFMFARGRRW